MSMREGFGPTGQPDMTRAQRIDTIRQLLKMERLDGGQILLYPGKNRTLVVLSAGKEVHLITEARDG